MSKLHKYTGRADPTKNAILREQRHNQETGECHPPNEPYRKDNAGGWQCYATAAAVWWQWFQYTNATENVGWWGNIEAPNKTPHVMMTRGCGCTMKMKFKLPCQLICWWNREHPWMGEMPNMPIYSPMGAERDLINKLLISSIEKNTQQLWIPSALRD